MPVLLLRACHPRQAVLTAAGMAVAAAVSGRAAREVGLVLATVLVGQAVLGWDNDLVDEKADRAAQRTDKPLATGALERGTVGFVLACAVLTGLLIRHGQKGVRPHRAVGRVSASGVVPERRRQRPA